MFVSEQPGFIVTSALCFLCRLFTIPGDISIETGCWRETTYGIHTKKTRQHEVSSSYHLFLRVCLSPWLMCNARSIWLPRCLMASICECQAGMIKELVLYDCFHPLPSTTPRPPPPPLPLPWVYLLLLYSISNCLWVSASWLLWHCWENRVTCHIIHPTLHNLLVAVHSWHAITFGGGGLSPDISWHKIYHNPDG